MDEPNSPWCTPCTGYLWCEDWEMACHLDQWNEVSCNLTRELSTGYSGAWGAKHDFNAHLVACEPPPCQCDGIDHQDDPTVEVFGGTNTEIVLEAACKFAPDFFLTATQGGMHWLRLKGPNGFQLDTDFQRLPQLLGEHAYIRFIIYTPQSGGFTTREWPLTQPNCAWVEGAQFYQCDRILTYLQPYRGNWGRFRFEIKLNTPGQYNGYFRFFTWWEEGQKWVNSVAFENVDIVGTPANPTYFNEFHWSNYEAENVPPNEGAYYYSDDLKVFVP